jgi:hypothetical protein
MTAAVLEFHRPKPVRQAAPKRSAPKLTETMKRAEWNAALAAIWANPNNWRRSQHGNAYIVIDDLGVYVVVITRDDGYFQWEMRWRDGRDPVRSRWIHVAEQTAIDEAWDAVLALA